MKTMCNIVDNVKDGYVPKELAKLFQSALIVMYFLALSGQRRQLIVSIYLDVRSSFCCVTNRRSVSMGKDILSNCLQKRW